MPQTNKRLCFREIRLSFLKHMSSVNVCFHGFFSHGFIKIILLHVDYTDEVEDSEAVTDFEILKLYK